jgi:hypothetical protein
MSTVASTPALVSPAHAPFPVALYGLNLAMCGFAFWILRIELARQHRHDPEMS